MLLIDSNISDDYETISDNSELSSQEESGSATLPNIVPDMVFNADGMSSFDTHSSSDQSLQHQWHSEDDRFTLEVRIK